MHRASLKKSLQGRLAYVCINWGLNNFCINDTWGHDLVAGLAVLGSDGPHDVKGLFQAAWFYSMIPYFMCDPTLSEVHELHLTPKLGCWGLLQAGGLYSKEGLGKMLCGTDKFCLTGTWSHPKDSCLWLHSFSQSCKKLIFHLLKTTEHSSQASVSSERDSLCEKCSAVRTGCNSKYQLIFWLKLTFILTGFDYIPRLSKSCCVSKKKRNFKRLKKGAQPPADNSHCPEGKRHVRSGANSLLSPRPLVFFSTVLFESRLCVKGI